MFVHCNRRFKSFEIWFLHNNRDFFKRKLYLGNCPVCGSCLAELCETRKYDGSVFRKTFYKKAAENIIHSLIKQVDYTSGDVKKIPKEPYGLCYGENIEIHNSKGKIIQIRQKKCDFYGTKEIILKIKPSCSS